jgi:hypothetical protein
MPLDVIVSETEGTPSGRLFAEGREFLARGDQQKGRTTFEAIAIMPGLESRYCLQAWHFFRETGGRPPDGLRDKVLGVIVEVGMDTGHDLLVVYADRTAHYHNHSGAGVVWKRPNASLDGLLNAVLGAARAILPRIGPWGEKRRPPPTQGGMRVNILTPVGLHFGEGSFEALQRDRLARGLVLAATNLMNKLTSMPFGTVDLFESN